MTTRALVYGDIDLNLIDGSAIWLQSVTQALARAGCAVTLVLKAPVRTSRLIAPLLAFTAEEAWCARFGEAISVHLELFPTLPDMWHDEALAAKWDTIRAIRRRITVPIEEARKANGIGSSFKSRRQGFANCCRADAR